MRKFGSALRPCAEWGRTGLRQKPRCDRSLRRGAFRRGRRLRVPSRCAVFGFQLARSRIVSRFALANAERLTPNFQPRMIVIPSRVEEISGGMTKRARDVSTSLDMTTVLIERW